MLKAALVVSLSLLLVGCQTTGSKTVDSVCKVFPAPGHAVKGVEAKDRRWINKTIESGIAACGWERPKSD